MDIKEFLYPDNIKNYEKLRIIGKGAFGYVKVIKKGLGSSGNNRRT
jgi:hypothetical protein